MTGRATLVRNSNEDVLGAASVELLLVVAGAGGEITEAERIGEARCADEPPRSEEADEGFAGAAACSDVFGPEDFNDWKNSDSFPRDFSANSASNFGEERRGSCTGGELDDGPVGAAGGGAAAEGDDAGIGIEAEAVATHLDSECRAVVSGAAGGDAGTGRGERAGGGAGTAAVIVLVASECLAIGLLSLSLPCCSNPAPSPPALGLNGECEFSQSVSPALSLTLLRDPAAPLPGDKLPDGCRRLCERRAELSEAELTPE
jgi:hypothetical protein